MAPPITLGAIPDSRIARMRPTESFRYEQRKRTSGSRGSRDCKTGTKSVVAKLYLVSDTTSKPNCAELILAPAIGFFVKSASAARIATVFGLGDCRAAV